MELTEIRTAAATAAVIAGLAAFAGCGGDDSSSAEVGDCINASNEVVDCSSSDAEQELVTDQSEPDAIACIEIGEPPQTEVEVGGKTFCAEPR